MTTLSNLKAKIASCAALIMKADALRPPRAVKKGEKPPRPSPEAIQAAEQLRIAADNLNEALAPALREYDNRVKARKEAVNEALLAAVKPFFGNDIDELGHRQIQVMHVPLRDALNAAFLRTFSPSWFHPEPTPEALVTMAEQHIAHMEKWASAFGWKLE